MTSPPDAAKPHLPGARRTGISTTFTTPPLLLPLLLLGAEGVSNLFRSVPHPLGRSAWLGAAALLLPLILGFGYAFPQALTEATALVVVLSVTIAIVNGTMEELLWRGTYSATFRGSRVLGWLYPSVGFGLWHFAPQSVFPNPAPGGSVSLVAVAIVIGLLWGHVARTSGSIRWTAVSHILFNVSGLGAHLYLS